MYIWILVYTYHCLNIPLFSKKSNFFIYRFFIFVINFHLSFLIKLPRLYEILHNTHYSYFLMRLSFLFLSVFRLKFIKLFVFAFFILTFKYTINEWCHYGTYCG